MLIYRIYHRPTGKSYIGQTVHPTFNERYSGGRWWDITDNPILKAAYAKYGRDDFDIEVLEQKVKSLDELNRLEEYHAERFNAYTPHGYNLRKCGDNRCLLPHQIESIRRAKAKAYTLRKVDTWELIEVTNLKAFCRTQGITSGSMYNMIHKNLGIVVAHGYCLPERTKEDIAERATRTYRGPYTLIHEDGRKVILSGLRLFAQEHGMEIGSLQKLVRGEMLYYHGWRLPARLNEPKTCERPYNIINPNGKQFIGVGVMRLCKEHGLRHSGITQVLRGERLHYHGWHLPSVTAAEVSRKRRKASERPLRNPARNSR